MWRSELGDLAFNDSDVKQSNQWWNKQFGIE